MNIAENIDCMKAMKNLPDKAFLWGTKLTSATTKRRKGALRNTPRRGAFLQEVRDE